MPPAEGQDNEKPSQTVPPGGASPGAPPGGHAIIVGFGLSGRATANALIARKIPLYVIERNAETVRRCVAAGLRIVEGDATDEHVLRRAGVETAAYFVATMPNEHAVLEMVGLARKLNPAVRIVARCEYVSTGMKLTRRGADEVVIAEQVVAAEFGRLVDIAATTGPASPVNLAQPAPLPDRPARMEPTGPR
jgi:voltage-gated potassium channel Kch